MREKKILMEKISKLGSMEHQEIYKILQTGGVSYSENNNGIFFNLTTMPCNLLEEIETFVNYCYENKPDLDEYDKKLNECKYLNNIDNIVKPIGLHSVINEPLRNKDRLNDLFDVVDKTNIVKEFIEKLNTNIEKSTHKRTGTKYAMAKKKYMKRATTEFDLDDDLDIEEYGKK